MYLPNSELSLLKDISSVDAIPCLSIWVKLVVVSYIIYSLNMVLQSIIHEKNGEG